MIDFDAFLETLPIMLKGMGGIFIVTFIIYLCIKILSKVFPSKD